MKRLDKSEIIFKVLAYVLLIGFALCCVYPLIYVISVSISSKAAVESGKVWIIPRGKIQFDAFKELIIGQRSRRFWLAYCNTVFFTVYGTLVSMFVAITGAYALSKTRLMFGRGFNFMLVFTMWFSAGMIPNYRNFLRMGIDNKYGYIIGLGFNAFNMVLLRNFFSSIPSEIEEAATIDGATEFQLLTKIYMPMSKTSIVTVTMFFALSRWNGWFWASMILNDEKDHPLQLVMRKMLNDLQDSDASDNLMNDKYAPESIQFAMIVCSIIPICIVYPQMQKYFAAGVNVGGVKE
ncbi:MAG: carbohydrate ABC transporter permease [Anaeroplasmataceae bacterium]